MCCARRRSRSPASPERGSRFVFQQSARQLGDSYESTTEKQWTQCIGFVHALFEVAIDTLRRTKDLASTASIRDAIAATNIKTVVGEVKWGRRRPI
jgi:branched-chain amino acid transport system substrate-binding protein